jgi:hypothetical protein
MSHTRVTSLPTAEDLNREAHPGGGTWVTDATNEGLVEDLFQAHLKNIDMATKSAVVKRLAELADRLDSLNAVYSASKVDLLLKKIADNVSVEDILTESKQTVSSNLAVLKKFLEGVRAHTTLGDVITLGLGSSTKDMLVDNLTRQLDMISTFVLNEKLPSALQLAQILVSEQSMTGDALTTAWGGDIDIEEIMSPAEVESYKNLMGEIIAALSKMVSAVAPAPQRERTESTKSLEYGALVENIFKRFDDIDRETDGLSATDPERFKRIDALFSKIPAIQNGSLAANIDWHHDNLDANSKSSDEALSRHIRQLTKMNEVLKLAESAMETE